MSNAANAHDRTQFRTLTLAALGVVYGDIGTSPLYAIREVFASPHHPVPITPDNVLGILSLVFWALMLVISGKYVSFIMRADNRGEGGIMALMALALRGVGEGRRRDAILLLGLFGAALFYGDGVITPTISVLSAVEGLEVITPAFKPFVIPLALIILVFLFIIQRHGTASVGRLFGPVMILWFTTLTLLGINSILLEPGVLRALNPAWAIGFLTTHPVLGFFSLGAVVLVITGGEALYADMGHFGRKPIATAWFGMVLPALLINYFGQGALLLDNPSAIENPFYLLAPTWALYPMVALSTAATIIASQAVISGAFSITLQAMQLGYLPRFAVHHTSESQMGQIYLPAINWLLLGAVVAAVIGFGSSSNIAAAAYGIAVTGTMLITNILAIRRRRAQRVEMALPAGTAVLWCPALGICVDLGVLLRKLGRRSSDGGWFPLVFGLVMFHPADNLEARPRSCSHEASRGQDSMANSAPFIASLAPKVVWTRVPGTAVIHDRPTRRRCRPCAAAQPQTLQGTPRAGDHRQRQASSTCPTCLRDRPRRGSSALRQDFYQIVGPVWLQG